MAINIILARTINGIIGINGNLPWSLPEDMVHFKQLTSGCAVVMGRKTWDSLPSRFRPLPGRTNVVITRQTGWFDDGAFTMHSLSDAVKIWAGDVWVIGGAEIYQLALPYADKIYVTEVNIECDGDAFSPVLGDEWIINDTGDWLTSINGPEYRFITYCKQSK